MLELTVRLIASLAVVVGLALAGSGGPAALAIEESDSPRLTTWMVAAVAGMASAVETTAAPARMTMAERAVHDNFGRGGTVLRSNEHLLVRLCRRTRAWEWTRVPRG